MNNNSVCDNGGESDVEQQWGPSHSEDAESTFSAPSSSRFFGSRKTSESAWSSFFEDLSWFQCGASPVSEEEEDAYTYEDPEPIGCRSLFMEMETQTPTFDEQTKSVWSAKSEEDVTLNEPSLVSILDSKRAWSSPARLDPVAINALQREDTVKCIKQGFPLLEDVFYASDMDTFLSDDLTEMEMGYFNNLYDQICKPCTMRRRRGGNNSTCYPAREGPKSVVLSFDDTISKLTIEDGKSLSTAASLNTLENLKRKTVDKATIAAIVHAQEMGDWKAKVQEEAEAKAEELSRFGIEHTFTASELVNQEPEAPNVNITIVQHYAEPQGEARESEQPWEALQSNFADITEVTQTEEEEDDEEEEQDQDEDREEAPPTKSGRRSFFKKILGKKKGKNESSKERKGPKQKRAWGLLTPPRKSKHKDRMAPSPTGTTVPSVSEDSSAQLSREQPDFSADITKEGPSSTVFEEVEVLSKRKEPVYTSYIRTQSSQFVEDVEILRKDSIHSHLEGTFDGDFRKLVSTSQDGYEGHDVLETVTKEEIAFPGWDLVREGAPEGDDQEEGDVPALGDLNDDDTSCSSLAPPSLLTMTSRLAKEQDETEQLRLMLERKDEDLEQLKELLRSNESAAVMERVNSSPSAPPTLQAV